MDGPRPWRGSKERRWMRRTQQTWWTRRWTWQMRYVRFKALVTYITAIEDLAGVTILCSDKTSTLTTSKLTIDRDTAKLMPPSLLTTLSTSRITHPALRTRAPSTLPLLVPLVIWPVLALASSSSTSRLSTSSTNVLRSPIVRRYKAETCHQGMSPCDWYHH